MKILIADDHALLRRGLAETLIQLDASVSVLEATDLVSACACLRHHPDADLAVIDLRMPGMNGGVSLRILNEAAATVPLVILSASEDPAEMRDALDHGAVGFISKGESPAVITNALRLVLAGGIYLPPALLKQPPASVSSPAEGLMAKLTPRQREVLRLLAEDKSNKEIARLLSLTEATVKAHVTAIFRALNVVSRTQAVRLVERMKLNSTQPET